MGFLSSIGKLVGGITGGDLLSAGVGLIGGGMSYAGQTSANSQNMAIAQKQMDFQASQTGTAYRRAMADMQKAGLNPIMAAGNGGAGAGSGAAIAMQDAMTPAVNSSQSARRLHQDLANAREENNLIKQQAVKVHTDSQLSAQQANTALSQERLNLQNERASKATERLTDANAALARLEIPGARNRAAVEDSPIGKGSAYIDKVMNTIGKGRSSLGNSSAKSQASRRGLNY